MKRIVIRALIVVAATLGIVFAQVAPASATPAKTLESNLAALWTTVLETPSAQNPFGTGADPSLACWDFGGTVAPLAPAGVESCTVKPGTKLFVTASTWECSTFPGDHFDFTTDEAGLRACAVEHDADVAPEVTLDGKSVPITEVVTPLVDVVLPADNIFGQPAGSLEGSFVAHGWVALLHPLTPGTHTIVIGGTITTTIEVTPGH